ncbi:MAG: DUF6230 family protein [Pseudonocardiaceae bacterium]
MGSTVLEGRTRWTRFAVVFALSLLIAAALLFGLAHGAIGASFAESGANFKTSASELRGTGFVQFGTIDRSADGAHPAARTGIVSASMDNFCQSALVPSLPLVGDVSVVIRAAGRDSVQASNLVVNISNLTGKATFQNIDVGIDASQLSKGPTGLGGAPGSFAQQADQVVLDNLQQTARRVMASTLVLNGLDLSIIAGRSECF